MSKVVQGSNGLMFRAGPKYISHSIEDLNAGRVHLEGDTGCLVCEREKWCPSRGWRGQMIVVSVDPNNIVLRATGPEDMK